MPARLRWTAYAGVSAALAGGVILKALAQRPNFYSAAVYLSQSSANLMILTNMIFVVACTVLLGLQKLLYGPLRPSEVEQLYEKAWFAVTETCLAMTIFRGEIGAWFLIMFFALLAGKVWGWIGEGRVEILEQQPPRNPRLFHTRLALSLGLSVGFDLTMLEYVVNQVMRMARPDMMVMFGFEFAVLSILSLSTAARYAIDLVEIGIVREQKRKRAIEVQRERIGDAARALEEARAEERRLANETGENTQPVAATAGDHDTAVRPTPTISPSIAELEETLRSLQVPVDENEIEVEGWEGKGRWVFYLDLATDFFKLVVYLSFFVILLVFYGLPIHIMRDVFLTCRSFFKRISDFVKYRTATRDMNARYPDATVEDIGREDVCIICREEMRPYRPAAPGEGGQPPAPNPVAERMRPKKLPCGHILHFSCLRSWLERQQICPTCRTPVVPTQQTGNAIVPGQPGAQAAGAAGQHPPGDRQGPRVFQFGPLRIGVGAARGNNMFEELQQRLADGRAAAAPPVNQNGPQQYGFGIRWDGGRRRGTRRTPTGTVREQIDAVERQLQQELLSIGQSTRELGLLRAMQMELDRVRAQRVEDAPAINTTQPPPTGGVTPAPVPAPVPAPHLGSYHALEPNVQAGLIHAGSESLPAGLTLPEGWSMLPLQPAAHHPLPPSLPGMASFHRPPPPPPPMLPPLNQAVAPGGFVQVPDHIRAMFSNMPGAPPNVMNGTLGQVPQTNGTAVQPVRDDGSAGHTAAIEQHERWLASLRNPQSEELAESTRARNGDSGPANPVEAQVNGNALRSTEPAHSAEDQQPGSTPTPLPSWGAPPLGSSGQSSATPSVSTAEHAEAEQTAAESSSRAGKNRQATVEDLVEGPD